MRGHCKKNPILFHLLILAAVTFAVFSNNYHHDYQLDDSYGLLDNSFVRSLKYIPLYFHDPRTLSSYYPNTDYRPILQTTFALNYWISGYNTWSWHLVQIILHLVCVIGLYLFTRRLMELFHPDEDSRFANNIPFLIALIFAIHPVNSGVINYLWARSSLLTAAFLLPSFVFHMKTAEDRRPLSSAILFGLALFTKIEAVAGLAVYFLWDVLMTARRRTLSGEKTMSGGLASDIWGTLSRREARRMGPYLVVLVTYFTIWAVVTREITLVAGPPGVTGYHYFCTQLTAWWYYIKNWFAPVNLIADNLAYPIFRSLRNPEVMLALAGWVFAAGVVGLLYQRRPYFAFVALTSLALISPTSSFFPMAEMVNEHRPYLSIAILSIAWLIPGLRLAFKEAMGRPRMAVIFGIGFILLTTSLGVLTYQRNRVFNTKEAYNLDIIKKAPSARAYNNYALILRAGGRDSEAQDYFRKGLEMRPNWHILHINLGIGYQREKNDSAALFHYSRAVELDQTSGTALVYRGRYYLEKKMYREALEDFEKSIPFHRKLYQIYKGMATAEAGLGEWEKSFSYTTKCFQENPVQIEFDIKSISTSFWERPDLWPKGFEYYRGVDRLLPGRWWVQSNLGDLALKLGRKEEAAKFFSVAESLTSGSTGPR